jgi:circadian clock protein KaiC
VRRGEAGLYITLSETKEELAAVTRSHGWSLGGLAVYEPATSEGLGAAENTFFHPSEVELEEKQVGRLRDRIEKLIEPADRDLIATREVPSLWRLGQR